MALDVQISFSWTNYCRLCLEDNGIMLPLFEGEGHLRKLSHKIESCLQLVTYDGDPLPRRICHTCLYKVNQMYDFRSMVWASYERLKLKLLPLHHVPEVQKYLEKASNLQKPMECSSPQFNTSSVSTPSTSKETERNQLPMIRVKSEEELMQAPDCSSWPSSTPTPQPDSALTEPYLCGASSISSSISPILNTATELALPPDSQSIFVGVQPDTLKRKRLSNTSDTSCDRVVSPVVKKPKPKKRQLAGPASRKRVLESKWVCNFCQTPYSSRQNLNRHLERCLKCRICKQEFSSFNDKVVHEAEMHVSVYIDCKEKHLSKRCSLCPARFASSVMLSMHVKEEHSTILSAPSSAQLHVEPQTSLESDSIFHSSQLAVGKGNNSRVDCKSDSEDEPLSVLKSDMNIKPVVSNEENICKMCDASCTNAPDLREHMRVTHNKFMCLYCDESFASINAVNAHKKLHVYKSKKAKNKSILKDILSSSKKKAFNCNSCFEGFEEEDAFILHLYVHATEYSDDESMPVKKNRKIVGASQKPVTASTNAELDNTVEQYSVKCERCHVVCRSKEYYQIHLATHMSKVKTNFPCSGCNQDFRNVEALNRHTCCGKVDNMQLCCLDCGQALVEGADHVCDNKCPACDKVFKSARGQRLHFVSKHKTKMFVEDGYYDPQSPTQNEVNSEECYNFQEQNKASVSPTISEATVSKSDENVSPIPEISRNESPDSQSSGHVSCDSRPCGNEFSPSHASGEEFSRTGGADVRNSIGVSPLMERLPPDGAPVDSLSLHFDSVEKNNCLPSECQNPSDNSVPLLKEPLLPTSFSSGILSNL